MWYRVFSSKFQRHEEPARAFSSCRARHRFRHQTTAITAQPSLRYLDSQAGVSDDEMIRRIESTRIVFRLSSDDVVRLRNDDVSDCGMQRREDYYNYDFDYRFGFFCDYPHRCWW
jgi:hypothetical protein